MIYVTMSDKPSVSVPSVPSDVIAEINEVLGRMNLSKKISDRVCQTPRWRRAASATRLPVQRVDQLLKLNDFFET